MDPIRHQIVRCPHCRAAIGETCRSLQEVAVPPHSERVTECEQVIDRVAKAFARPKAV